LATLAEADRCRSLRNTHLLSQEFSQCGSPPDSA
jgi:hypothetical protein